MRHSILPIAVLVALTFGSMAQVAPPLKVPASVSQWQQTRDVLRREFTAVLGDLPPRPSNLQVKIISRENRGKYVVEKFEFDNGAGAIVPGYFLIPSNGRTKHPAIYYCHWHGGNYDLGKAELFGTHHTPEIPAEALTSRGFAVLAIDAYCFGERSGKGPGGSSETGSSEEMTSSKLELWKGRSLWGMMVRDDQIAFDYLMSRPEIDPTHVGVTGISMGATRTWWLMALDDRIRTGVAVGCMTRYQDLIAEEKLKYHGIYYYVPGILKLGDTESVIALIAPRPVLFMTGDEDPGSPQAGIRKIESAVRSVYQLYNKPDQFENIIYPHTAHVYTDDMWKRMLSWMESHLAQP